MIENLVFYVEAWKPQDYSKIIYQKFTQEK